MLLIRIIILFLCTLSLFAEEEGFINDPGPASETVKEAQDEQVSSLPADVTLTLEEAEQMFLKNNLSLLTARYNIDVKKALIIQAGLYPNPNVFFEQNAYNPKTFRYFDFTPHGSTVVQIQQLFLLGGKLSKRVQVARLNAELSEYEFYDLMRSLKYELRRNYFAVHYNKQLLTFYDHSLDALRLTVTFAEKAYEQRAMLLHEVLRLKTLLLQLEKEKVEVYTELKEAEATLRVLLNDPRTKTANLHTKIDDLLLDRVSVDALSKDKALNVALEYRPDLKKAIQNIKLGLAQVELQKAYSYPDVAVGPVFNRANTYIPQYTGFTASISVPLFDRNEGNIEAAEKDVVARRADLEKLHVEITHEIEIIHRRMVEKDKIYGTFKNTFTRDYARLADLMVENYKKRYITIIEFADFFESYRTSMQNMIQLQIERIEAIESMNHAMGYTFLRIQ